MLSWTLWTLWTPWTLTRWRWWQCCERTRLQFTRHCAPGLFVWNPVWRLHSADGYVPRGVEDEVEKAKYETSGRKWSRSWCFLLLRSDCNTPGQVVEVCSSSTSNTPSTTTSSPVLIVILPGSSAPEEGGMGRGEMRENEGGDEKKKISLLPPQQQIRSESPVEPVSFELGATATKI